MPHVACCAQSGEVEARGPAAAQVLAVAFGRDWAADQAALATAMVRAEPRAAPVGWLRGQRLSSVRASTLGDDFGE